MPLSKFNLHTHTAFCDGKELPEKYVKEAIDQGFNALGFSGHAPVPFESTYTVAEEDMEAYCKAVLTQKEKFRDQIEIYLSLEFDFIPGLTKDFSYSMDKYQLDYSIGSVHLVKHPLKEKLWFIDGGDPSVYDAGLRDIFEDDFKLAVRTYYQQIVEMVETQQPTIIGHLDKIKMHNNGRYFQQNEEWYQKLIHETLSVIKKYNCIVEVNTRGIYKKRCMELFPGIEVLNLIHELEIPVTISTDAHKPSELSAYFDETSKILAETGFKTVMILEKGNWVEQSIL